MKYETAHQDLAAALPELQPCIDRLVADWNNFGDEPPGQYIVFDTYRVWLEVLVGLVSDDADARALFGRGLDLAQEMLTSDDPELRYLAMDAAEALCAVPGSHEVVEELAGPAVRGWLADFGGSPNLAGQDPEIIDLWGVREVLADRLPHVPLPELPGISQPADHHRLRSLSDARASADGVVLLHAFGTSGMAVLARASVVSCDEGSLQRLAAELAPIHHPKDADVLTRGKPGVAYFNIPTGERVWNMTIGSERHARLDTAIDVWLAPELINREAQVRAQLARS
jgi:hypothetical protein